MSNDKIIAKVEALLRKADSTNEHERTAILSKVAELCARHLIDQNDLDPNATEQTVKVETLPEDFFRKGWKNERWTLLCQIAEVYGCISVANMPNTPGSRNPKNVRLAGRTDRIELVKSLFKLIEIQADRVILKAKPDEETIIHWGGGFKPAETRVWRRGLWQGFTAEIHSRLQDKLRVVAKEEDNRTFLPALIDDVKAAEAAIGPFRTTKSRAAQGGYAAGATAGATADIGNTRMGPAPKSLGR